MRHVLCAGHEREREREQCGDVPRVGRQVAPEAERDGMLLVLTAEHALQVERLGVLQVGGPQQHLVCRAVQLRRQHRLQLAHRLLVLRELLRVRVVWQHVGHHVLELVDQLRTRIERV